MRRLALAAAAALAACSVKLEGAPCTSDANCPDNQRCDGAGAQPGQCVVCVAEPACGGDGTFCVAGDDTLRRVCSTNVGGCRYSIVTACAAPQVCQGTPGAAVCGCPPVGSVGSVAGDSCTSAGAQACDAVSGNVLACVSSGGCQVWQTSTDCVSQGLTCRTPAGQPLCACPDNSGDLFADATSGSASGAAPYPTGLATPAACRFRSLTDALARASSGSTVRMTGASGSGAVVFSYASSGEAFPLIVKPGVTLTTSDSPPDPAHYLIEVDKADTMRPVLELDHDTAVSGFTVQPATGGSASEAVLVSCAIPGTNAVALSDLVLDGKGSLPMSAVGDGLTLSTQCGVSVQSVVARNAAKAGIRVNTAGLTTSPPAISIATCFILSNGDSGLVVQADLSLGQLSVSVTGNRVALNNATTPFTDGTATRRGGGVVLRGAVPQTFAFTGNTIYGNSFDQVLVYSSGSWNLSATACGSGSNTFTCYDTGNGGGWVGVSALGGAQVTATDDSWAHGTPSAGIDFFQALGSTVNVGTTSCPANTTCP